MSSLFISPLSRLSLKSRASLASVALSALALVAAAPAAHAQANLTFTGGFTGGGSTPLTLVLSTPITYTVTTANTNFNPAFIFDAVGGGSINGSGPGTITYSINNGTPRTINNVSNGFASNDQTADDLYLFSSSASQSVSVGDVISLTSGSLTTSSNVSGIRPSNGTFNTFIVNNGGTRISSNGTITGAAAPEPGSVTLLALAGLPALGTVARRRRKTA